MLNLVLSISPMKKVNKEFGNILRKNKNRQRGIQYSCYIKTQKEREGQSNRISFHNQLKAKYGSNYMQEWRK